ncbi:hypothetical protein FRC10_009692 [Ceratobasidium sp. 414]|nr:hypothetical protein FRC10_009692 [Ceratobasidium sp. 414]
MYLDSDDDSSIFSEARPYDDNTSVMQPKKPLTVSVNWQIVAEGIHATIYKIDQNDARISSHETVAGAGLRAVKSVSAFKNARLEPHDIRSEIHILARLSHPNLLEASYSHQQKIYEIAMPFIPLTLGHLLENPNCSPYPPPRHREALNTTQPAAKSSQFLALAKSFLYQITSALAFLHTHESQPIAHRDLKPSNLLVSSDGCIRLADFGISWEDCPRGHGASFQEPRGLHDNGRLNGFSDAPKPEWDETPEHMCCQVSSGPYRALELLFAPRRYDALAVDLWGLGVLASGFFTSFVFKPKEISMDLREFDWDALIPEGAAAAPASEIQSPPDPDPTLPFNVPDIDTDVGGTWHRMPLFDCTRGEIGLIASIFKLIGTPTDTTWPGFKSLPAASALVFNPVSPRPLRPLLPHLPPSHMQTGGSAIGSCLAADGENAVDFIKRLIRYPPESRTKAPDLLRHAYFAEGCPLLLPPIYTDSEQNSTQEGLGSLPDLIAQVLSVSG